MRIYLKLVIDLRSGRRIGKRNEEEYVWAVCCLPWRGLKVIVQIIRSIHWTNDKKSSHYVDIMDFWERNIDGPLKFRRLGPIYIKIIYRWTKRLETTIKMFPCGYHNGRYIFDYEYILIGSYRPANYHTMVPIIIKNIYLAIIVATLHPLVI